MYFETVNIYKIDMGTMRIYFNAPFPPTNFNIIEKTTINLWSCESRVLVGLGIWVDWDKVCMCVC